MAQAAARVESGVCASVDISSTIAGHTGPACLYDADRHPLLANCLWLAAGLPGPTSAEGARVPTALSVEMVAALRSGRTGTTMCTHRTTDGEGRELEFSLEFTIIPVNMPDGRALAVLGADRTIVGNLQRALAESREFHRSFVSCSGDFIWQVDPAGIIDYVSPRGLLDYTVEELFGAPISRFIGDPNDPSAALLFVSREPIWEQEVWLLDRNRERHCFLISSVPIRNQEGRWTGARGVGRDVTEERIREEELQKARHSHRMVQSVLHAMRSEVDPRAILDAAAIVAADTAHLDACLVLMADAESAEWVARTIPGGALDGAFATGAAALVEAIQLSREKRDRRLKRLTLGGAHFLLSPTAVEGELNGGVVFGRAPRTSDEASAPWTVEEEHILRAVADQMGVALAQFALVEDLRRRGERHSAA